MEQPGRELDALVAEKAMGMLTQVSGDRYKYYWMRPSEDVHWDTLPRYSTDIATAWALVEKFRLAVTPWSTQGWIATVEPGEGWICPADTAPHAICLAALFIVGNRHAPAVDAPAEET
jgi:hypothetical protein